MSILARRPPPYALRALRSLSTASHTPPTPESRPQVHTPAPSNISINHTSQSTSSSTSKSRILDPRPRPANSHHSPRSPALPTLPASFGRNQLLPVSHSTRALLESIVAQFNAPIRYAFAYGSGVFEQDGYKGKDGENKGEAPMLDFMFAVTHPDHWHSINMQQNPSHYAVHARMLGSGFVSKVEDIAPGVWFNAYVPTHGVVSLAVLQ